MHIVVRALVWSFAKGPFNRYMSLQNINAFAMLPPRKEKCSTMKQPRKKPCFITYNATSSMIIIIVLIIIPLQRG